MSSPVCQVHVGDDLSVLTVVLTAEEGVYEEPSTLVIRVRTDEDLFEYPLTVSETEGTWTGELTTDDIDDLGLGNHRAELYATFASGEKRTLPTRLTVQVLPILTAP